MPWLVLVCHTARGDDLGALNTAGGELLFVAASAVDLLFPGDETLSPDGSLAHHAAETFLVPLAGLVFHLLVTCSEDLSAPVAFCGKLRVVTGSAVDLLHLAAELLVYKRHLALLAQETLLVPMLVLIRQILGINTNDLVAVIAGIGEDALVATGAVRMVIFQDIALTSETLIALPTAEVFRVPVLRHRLGVLAAIDAGPFPRRLDGRGGGSFRFSRKLRP